MMIWNNVRGTVHGRTIEIDDARNLPEGTRVRLTIEVEAPIPPVTRMEDLPGFGALADCPEEVDAFDAWCREHRGHNRRDQGLEP